MADKQEKAERLAELFAAWAAIQNAGPMMRPARNPLDESQEQLGPVDVGPPKKYAHYHYLGNLSRTYCGEPPFSAKVYWWPDRPDAPICPDCRRIFRDRGIL